MWEKFKQTELYDSIRSKYFLWYLFRCVFKHWTSEKIILKLIAKEHRIIGVKLCRKPESIKQYINSTDRWYAKFRFSNVDQEIKLYKYYYRIMKLHYSWAGIETDENIRQSWPMTSLCYVFSIKGDRYDSTLYLKAKKFRSSYPKIKIFWRILEYIFNGF